MPHPLSHVISVVCYIQVPALEHKNTLVYLNKFVIHTTQFLNRFSTVCEEVRVCIRTIITPCTCARSKAISSVRLLSVVCHKKIAGSEDSGITVVSKYDQIVGNGEKLSFFCFLMLGSCHKRYKLCDYIGHT